MKTQNVFHTQYTQNVFHTQHMLLIIFPFAQFSYLYSDESFTEMKSNEEHYISSIATVDSFVFFGCCSLPVWQLVA
jgi:hypothetical protein